MTDVSNRVPVPSSLLINGQPYAFLLTPYIGEHGFWLWNGNENEGPHFNIALTPARLAATLEAATQFPIDVDLSFSPLGHVDALRGRPACDCGTLTRPIRSLHLDVTKNHSFVVFTFHGDAGPVDPATDALPETRGDRSAYDFALLFKVPIRTFKSYCASEESFDALAKRLKLYPYSVPGKAA